jgi:hypothetical protein
MMKPYYEPGLYKCRIIEQGFNEASTGTPQFWLRFQVLGRIEPFNDSLEKYSRTIYFAVTQRTADRVMQDLHTLGFKGDQFDGIDPRIEGSHSFVNSEVELICSHEDGKDGTPREKWRVRGSGRPLNADKVHNLNRLLTKVITDDDVPF